MINKEMKYVILPNRGEFELDYIYEKSIELRKFKWSFTNWSFRPALVDINGNSREYLGQDFDSDKFELIENGWTHDHCEICFTNISEGDNNSDFEIDGFEYDSDWICKCCYENLIEPIDLDKTIESLIKK